MMDDKLRIAFDYKYPDAAALVVYELFGSSIFGVEDSVRIRKAIVGDKAIELYSQLTGKSIRDINKEAISKKIFETKKEEKDEDSSKS